MFRIWLFRFIGFVLFVINQKSMKNMYMQNEI